MWEMVLELEISQLAENGARSILAAFERYHQKFKQITRQAQKRFENRDWRGVHRDAVVRLDLYTREIDRIVSALENDILTLNPQDEDVWRKMRHSYASLITGRDDSELAKTFFNSVSRRIFTTIGVNAEIEFSGSDFEMPVEPDPPICRRYERGVKIAGLIMEILRDAPFEVGYQDLERDASLAALEIERHLRANWGSSAFEAIEMARPVFYRGHGAYLVGRIRKGAAINPLVLALLNSEHGLVLDAVLLVEDEVSILFSFARSYFLVETEIPYKLVRFLKSIIPLKRVAELYISIGYNKHGKTELYRDLIRHLAHSDDKFEISPGERGMVMVAFAMPSYDVVFKVIKDRFDEPKRSSRQDVIDRYQLVYKHDRAGRLVDAQEFEHLEFKKDRFSDDLLQELLAEAANSVILENGDVVINHLYAERRTTPLNIYLKEEISNSLEEVVVDFGQAIKDLAAMNIFPGDILLKNFGVTRHGRVVFYDYDELCLVTDCKFRAFPQARDFYDDFSADPWFYVGKNDIFPEEFRTFLGISEPLRSVFIATHDDLFDLTYWRRMQKKHEAGELVDIFPYKHSRRLHRNQS